MLQEATAQMNLGAILHMNGKLQEAELSYLAALKLRPDDSVTRDNLQKLRAAMNARNKRWLVNKQSFSEQPLRSELQDDDFANTVSWSNTCHTKKIKISYI